MDCCSLACSKKAIDNKVCRKCYMRAYCSEECRENDWNNLHKSQCKSQVFMITDFFPMSSQKLLGKGTYGEVQLVKHRPTGQLYALKEIKKFTKQRKVPIKMLFSEISVQKRLIHPNIIRLYGHVETQEKVTLVLEYADGGNLYSHLKKKFRLPEREAFNNFSQICKGLQYLHEKNVIHRDIKPDNILITKSGGVKICDFGWCASGDNVRTTYCGTLDYMAPEILNGSCYSSKVDIWSLGVLLFEILQGSVPFRGRDQMEKLGNINKGNIDFCFSTSQAAQKLIRQMLSKNPENRPEIAEILQSEWMIRYSDINIPITPLASPKIKGKAFFNNDPNQDEFDLKLTKNYPASYKVASRLSANFLISKRNKGDLKLSEDSSNKEDSNSNISSYSEENKDPDPFLIVSQVDLAKRQKELERLQIKLEGRSRTSKPKSFFSKVMSVIGIN